MKRKMIYPIAWTALHPDKHTQASDGAYVALANKLYHDIFQKQIPDDSCARAISLYLCAYLEDLVSGCGLWQAFVDSHRELYGKPLPFYRIETEGPWDEVQPEALQFLIWNTWQKCQWHTPLHPEHPLIRETAAAAFILLDEAYETIPENPSLTHLFQTEKTDKERAVILEWLFGRTYLTAPLRAFYQKDLSGINYYQLPCGPLAQSLSAWLEALQATDSWKNHPGVAPESRKLDDSLRLRHRQLYDIFTRHNNGQALAYLDGYAALRHFLTGKLGWPDDDAHTFIQLKDKRDFVLKADPEKGMLLATDVCRSIADPQNPYYDPETARREAYRMLSIPTVCPPDLLHYCLQNHYLPDAQFPDDADSRTLVQENADFLARQALGFYYHGD